ncbi:MAG: response regulator [bacterium]|nr:response regulator [bacterium]
MKVLLVEDNESNMLVVRTVLEAKGHEVLWALEAEAGLVLAQENQPDLILMDIQLPTIDGLEATRRLKTDPTTARIPVVALTAYAMPSDKRAALEAGCIDYISKPFQLDPFVKLVESFQPEV